MKLAIYFKLIRWKNILLIAYIFLLLKFVLFPSFEVETNLNHYQFFMLLLAVLLITAAGYISNDICDIKADEINKPHKLIVSKLITTETAYSWYKITNTIGIALGILLCLNISKPTYSFIFIGTAILLNWYAKKLKGVPFIGNLVVSFLVGFSIFTLALFDLNLDSKNEVTSIVFSAVLVLSSFAFLINLIRELIKDIEDVNGDNLLQLKTLPIVIGRNRTKRIALVIAVFTILFLVYFVLNYSTKYKFTSLYLVVFTIIPFLFTLFKLNGAKTKKQFHQVSTFLKVIMFLGVNSIIIFSKYH